MCIWITEWEKLKWLSQRSRDFRVGCERVLLINNQTSMEQTAARTPGGAARDRSESKVTQFSWEVKGQTTSRTGDEVYKRWGSDPDRWVEGRHAVEWSASIAGFWSKLVPHTHSRCDDRLVWGHAITVLGVYPLWGSDEGVKPFPHLVCW